MFDGFEVYVRNTNVLDGVLITDSQEVRAVLDALGVRDDYSSLVVQTAEGEYKFVLGSDRVALPVSCWMEVRHGSAVAVRDIPVGHLFCFVPDRGQEPSVYLLLKTGDNERADIGYDGSPFHYEIKDQSAKAVDLGKPLEGKR